MIVWFINTMEELSRKDTSSEFANPVGSEGSKTRKVLSIQNIEPDEEALLSSEGEIAFPLSFLDEFERDATSLISH